MKRSKKHIQPALRILISALLCLGFVGASVYAFPDFGKQFKVKPAASKCSKLDNPDPKNPFPPVNPFEEKNEDSQETENDFDSESDFISGFQQLLLVFAAKDTQKFTCTVHEVCSYSGLPLYILFHSWKNYLS